MYASHYIVSVLECAKSGYVTRLAKGDVLKAAFLQKVLELSNFCTNNTSAKCE